MDNRSEAYMSQQGEPRGERDVIRLRNPTEDRRAFRRMLMSADRRTNFRHLGIIQPRTGRETLGTKTMVT